MKRARRLLLLVTLVARPGAAAEAPVPRGTEAGMPHVRTFTRRDLEPPGEATGPQVFSIAQDSRGVLFLANNVGVLEHDAVGWRSHVLPTRSAPLSLAFDAEGTLYAGAGDDLGYFEPAAGGSLRFHSLLPLVPQGAPPVKDVWQVSPRKDGVWFRSETALYLYHAGRVDVIPARAAFKVGGVAGDLLVVRENGVGLLKLEAGRATSIPGSEPLGNERIFFYTSLDGRRILAGARSGLLLFDPATRAVERFRTDVDEELVKAEVYAGCLLRDGSLAVGTSWNGVYVIGTDGRLLLHLGRANGLPDDEVYSLLVDRDGALWIGFNNGLARAEVPSALTRVSERNGLTGFVEAIARGRDGLYLATSSGVSRLRPGPQQAVVEKVPGITEMAWDVAAVGDRILAATDDGLFSIEPASSGGAPRVTRLRPGAHRQVRPLRRVPPRAGSPAPATARIALGTGDGLLTAEIDAAGRLTAERRMHGVDDACIAVLEAPDGTLSCGTESQGVYLERNGSAQRLASGDAADRGLGAGYAYPFLLDGAVLVGTTRGLRRWDDDRRRFVPDGRLGAALADGTLDVFRLVEDHAGRVFARAGRTTPVFRRDAAGAYRPEPGPVARIPGWVDVRAFLTEDGAGTGGADVTWIGSREGLYRVDWGLPPVGAADVLCLIRRATGRGQEILFDGTGVADLRVPFSREGLRLEYAATAFEDPGATRYRTWLEGFEERSPTATSETRREFTNLPEGSYRFHVTAEDLLDRRSADTLLPFVVLPPWYRTPAAYALWAALALGAVAAVVQLRLYTLRRRTNELEEAVQARTFELADSNRKLSDAQARIAELVETSRQALEDLSEWVAGTGHRIAEATGARAIDAFAFEEGGAVEPLSGRKRDGAPTRASLEQALLRSRAFREGPAGAHVPVELALAARGASGEVFGVLVARGLTSWDDTGRRLLEGFAHQLGGALEMRRLRRRLATVEAARAAVRADLERRGVVTLRVCPSCQRCYDSATETCAADARPLEAPRLLPYRLLERYRLDRVLGEGGMGTVFLAHDERLDREVAIKVIRPERFDDPATRARFEREAHTVARISHPGVVSLHDSGTLDDGSAFLVMERLRGLDLGALLHAHGRGTPRQVAAVARQGGAALAAAHRAGVVHRDVKPENVVVSSTAAGLGVKIVDFGLAKELSAGDGLTRTGTVVGTPWYMSPEQVDGHPVSGRSDLYSFAAVLYEALTGQRTASAETLGQVFDQVLRSTPPEPSRLRRGLGPDVDLAFEEALRKDPLERPPDVETWGARLADALEQVACADRGWPEPIGETAPGRERDGSRAATLPSPIV